jgi:glycosyltransferase involved in cell wall biosynthesis
VLFVGPDMETGGAQRQWAALARGLRERGHEVTVAALSSRGELYSELEAAGIDVRFVGLSRRSDPRGLRRALGLSSVRPDVVVTREVSGQLVGEAVARRARAPHLMTEHTPLRPDGSLLPRRPHQRLLTRVVAPAVDAVAAVTAAQVEPLRGWGYRRARIEVVPNGVFAEDVRSGDRGAARAELGLEDGDFAALLAAGLRPEKRVDVFVDAVAAARREEPRLRGLVAGEGRERARIERLIAERGGGVRLLGARDDVAGLIHAADAVCLSSDAEALPMALLEAMALARPVVATAVGGVAEAVADGETGHVVAPGDAAGFARALASLAADAGAAKRLGEAGRTRQRERFDGPQMVARYERLLEETAA